MAAVTFPPPDFSGLRTTLASVSAAYDTAERQRLRDAHFDRLSEYAATVKAEMLCSGAAYHDPEYAELGVAVESCPALVVAERLEEGVGRRSCGPLFEYREWSKIRGLERKRLRDGYRPEAGAGGLPPVPAEFAAEQARYEAWLAGRREAA